MSSPQFSRASGTRSPVVVRPKNHTTPKEGVLAYHFLAHNVVNSRKLDPPVKLPGVQKCLKDSDFLPIPQISSHQPPPQLRPHFTMSTSDGPYTLEPTAPKKTIWKSIRENPKVIFIAFFAS